MTHTHLRNLSAATTSFGFNTYGEQFRSMHLNQTFTGVAIGRDAGAAMRRTADTTCRRRDAVE